MASNNIPPFRVRKLGQNWGENRAKKGRIEKIKRDRENQDKIGKKKKMVKKKKIRIFFFFFFLKIGKKKTNRETDLNRVFIRPVNDNRYVS